MTDLMGVDLEDFDTRDVWILESSIGRKSSTEVGLLPIQPLLSHILISAGLHGFLRSVDITE